MTDPILVPYSGTSPGYTSPMAAFAHSLARVGSPHAHLVASVSMFNGREPHALIVLKQPVQLWAIDLDRKPAGPSLTCAAFILIYKQRDNLHDAWMCDNIAFASNLWKTVCEQKGLHA